MNYAIRDATREDIPVIVDIIRNSFKEVAVRFGLTLENCPKHPSNCTAEWIAPALLKGIEYFLLETEDSTCGCVALEKAGQGVCYLERLAVLPRYRNRGFGKALVDHALSHAVAAGAARIEIGIIADHTELKNWYKKIGFVEIRRSRFRHLPFEVTFMAIDCSE